MLVNVSIIAIYNKCQKKQTTTASLRWTRKTTTCRTEKK